MKRALAMAVTATVIAATVPASVAQASASVREPRSASACVAGAGLTLDLAGAARVPIVVGKARKSKPAGTARAQVLADALLSKGVTTVCDMPLQEWDQASIDEVQTLMDSGDVEGAQQYLRDLVDGIYVPAEDATTIPASGAAIRRSVTRSAGVCQGFGMSEIQLPSDIALALKLAEKAQMFGDDAVADTALGKARSIMEGYARSGADGQAATIGDWLRLAQQLQLLGADDALADNMLDNARAVAKQAYDTYNLTRCRHTKESAQCYFKAAMAMELLGVEPSPSMKDMQEASTALVSLNMGRRPPTCVETYAFRAGFSWETETGEYLTMDTGRVVFDAEFGKITSESKGPLVLSSVNNAPCWQKTDDGWMQVGSATLRGGSFPYWVTGTDLDGTLRVRLMQDAQWKVTASGGADCQFLAEFGSAFLNAFPRVVKEGMPIPAGTKSYEEDNISYQLHEPTGKMLKSHWFFSIQLLKTSKT